VHVQVILIRVVLNAWIAILCAHLAHLTVINVLIAKSLMLQLLLFARVQLVQISILRNVSPSVRIYTPPKTGYARESALLINTLRMTKILISHAPQLPLLLMAIAPIPSRKSLI